MALSEKKKQKMQKFLQNFNPCNYIFGHSMFREKLSKSSKSKGANFLIFAILLLINIEVNLTMIKKIIYEH